MQHGLKTHVGLNMAIVKLVNFKTTGKLAVSFMLQHVTSPRKHRLLFILYEVHWGPMEKKMTSCVCLQWDSDTAIIKPRAWLLYRLIYHVLKKR
jgi:hypothetical protein